MSQRKKEIFGAIFVISAFLLVGTLDAQDAECSWNGCGDARFTQQ